MKSIQELENWIEWCRDKKKGNGFIWKDGKLISEKEVEAKLETLKEVLDLIDEVYHNLDMGKTIPIFIQRVKERITEGERNE